MPNQLDAFMDALEEEEKKKQQALQEIKVPEAVVQPIPNQTSSKTELYDSTIGKEFSNPNYKPLFQNTGKKSLSELEENPEFAKRATRFLQSINENDNIFEYLRDADYSLSSAAIRAGQTNSWDEQQIDDYVYLKQQFDNAELKGFKERFTAVKDIGIDILGDPFNILAALFAIPTGGTSLATRGALGTAAQAGLKRLSAQQIAKRQLLKKAKTLRDVKQTAKIGALEGAAIEMPHGYFLSDIDVDLGLRDEIDASMIAGRTLLGAGIGGAAGGVAGAVTGLYGNRYLTKEFKYTNETAIDDIAESQTRKEINDNQFLEDSLEHKSKNNLYKILSNTQGKPTTKFLAWAEKSKPLQELLKKFRYDYDSGMFKEGYRGVKEKSYGLAVGERQGKYLYGLAKGLNVLYRVGFRGKIIGEQNDQLFTLLSDKSINLKNIDNLKNQNYSNKFGINFNINDDIISSYKGVKTQIDDAFEEGRSVGLFGTNIKQGMGYLPRLFKYDILNDKRGKFEQLLIKAGHADPLNDIEEITIKTSDGVKVKGIKEDAVGIDQDVFGRDFLKDAEGNLDKAKELKATQIVDDMLEYRWVPFELRSKRKAGSSGSFMQQRRFSNLENNEIQEFIETDVQTILEDYFVNISQAIERTRFFGKSTDNFNSKQIQPVVDDLINKGLSKKQAEDVRKGLLLMHSRVTGIETFSESTLKRSNAARGTADWAKLSQQMAHLPWATLSSVTEPLILLTRVGITDVPFAITQVGKAIVKEGGSVVDRSVKALYRLSGGKTKNVKDLDDEAWGELYKTGLALEQAVQERIEGLAGEGLYGPTAKTMQQAFFKANLLTQWTKAVQLASFTTGKRLIKTNARQLATGKTVLGRKLTEKNKKYLTQQLNDLGIDKTKAVNWYNKSLRNNKFDDSLAKKQDFYREDLTSGANRFTKEIILNPSTAEANRPLWFSTPAAQLLVQFAGYPTVFNNTILRRFANEAYNYPVQTIPKLIPTALLMTAVAHVGNTIRSQGNNYYDYETEEPKPEGEMIGEALRRWGGTGPFDYAYRFTENEDRNAGQLTSALKTFAGPLPQDVIDGISFRKGIPEIAVTNIPGYSILPYETRKDIRKFGRDLTKEPKKEKEDYKSLFSKGGLVYDVPKVGNEPDEIKMRGVNATYNEVAGVILKDEEDRGITKQMEDLLK